MSKQEKFKIPAGLWLSLVCLLLILSFNNCDSGVKFDSVKDDTGASQTGEQAPPPASTTSGESNVTPTPTVMPVPSPTPVAVCDPFNQNNNAGSKTKGLSGKLFYFGSAPAEQNQYVNYFINYGITDSNVKVYLQQINTPTTLFSRGFTTTDGHTLKNASGTKLVEWFALSLDSQLGLAQGESDRAVQLALLTDDGSKLYIENSSGDLELLINNDNTHPSRLACATKPVYLTQNKKLKLHVDYFQGPATEIAFMLLWRPYPTTSGGSSVMDIECGKEGQGYFFNYLNDPPTPKSTYLGMLNRGWEPVPADNFHLSEESPNNPCVQ